MVSSSGNVGGLHESEYVVRLRFLFVNNSEQSMQETRSLNIIVCYENSFS